MTLEPLHSAPGIDLSRTYQLVRHCCLPKGDSYGYSNRIQRRQLRLRTYLQDDNRLNTIMNLQYN